MPFIIHHKLENQPGYSVLKEYGDQLLEEKELHDYTIEVRPATSVEEKAVAGEGLSPAKDSGDKYASDVHQMVVYRTQSVNNPWLEELASNPERTAERMVDRLLTYIDVYHSETQ